MGDVPTTTSEAGPVTALLDYPESLRTALDAWSVAALSAHVPVDLVRILQYEGAGTATLRVHLVITLYVNGKEEFITLRPDITVTAGHGAMHPADVATFWNWLHTMWDDYSGFLEGVSVRATTDLPAPVERIEMVAWRRWPGNGAPVVITNTEVAR